MPLLDLYLIYIIGVLLRLRNAPNGIIEFEIKTFVDLLLQTSNKMITYNVNCTLTYFFFIFISSIYNGSLLKIL